MSNEPAAILPETDAPAVCRLFFAWHPDDRTRSMLLDWQQRIGRSRQLDDGIRWLGEDQLHVTLLFLGDVPVERVEPIIERAAAAIQGLVDRGVKPGFQLDRLVFFPRRSRPRVLVLAGPANEPLKQWHRTLRQAVVELLPEVDRPLPLKPHVTLGRVTSHKATGAKLARVREPIDWNCGPLNLMETQLHSGGPVHVTRWTQSVTD